MDELAKRAVRLDQHVDPAEMDQGVAMGARHGGVHLGDDPLRHRQDSRCEVDADAETGVTAGVRDGDLNHRHVHRQAALGEQGGNLIEADRNVINDRPAGISVLAAGDKEAVADDGVRPASDRNVRPGRR